MKIAAGRVDAFIKNPDTDVKAVLIYGPDSGLVRERGENLARAIVHDVSDPFLMAEINAAQLRDDPSLIADEAAAIALTGGRRVVRVRDAGDAIAGPLESLLDNFIGDALVIVQAGNLGARAVLRKLFESAANAAAIACYADDAQSLDRVIHDTLAKDAITANSEAVEYLVANLGTDRGVSRSELTKLALYVGNGGTATIDDAMAVVGDTSALSLDTVVMSAAGGDGLAADRALNRSYQEGANPVSVLRALGRHLIRLQSARAAMDNGASAEIAMKSLRPPVFFKLAGAFRRQLQTWNPRKLAVALELVIKAESQCKQTGTPADALCGRTVLQISRLGSAQRR